MLNELLHASQWCHRHSFSIGERIFDKLKILLCSVDIPGRTISIR